MIYFLSIYLFEICLKYMEFQGEGGEGEFRFWTHFEPPSKDFSFEIRSADLENHEDHEDHELRKFCIFMRSAYFRYN